jgi:hypothetical protein
VTVTIESWNGSDFVAKDAEPYERQGDEWHLADTRADEPAH